MGLEGLFGLIFGLILYITIGEKIGETPKDALNMLKEDSLLVWWVVSLPILFLITGIFNITATQVTSSMTRNVWKNFRTILVWVIALLLYYLSGRKDIEIGEQWFMPESFYILLGFFVMVIGITVYYWQKKQEETTSSSEESEESFDDNC